MKVLAIDPGPVFSAYCIIDSDDYFCLECDKVRNESLHKEITRRLDFDEAVIESMSSYGARVGESVMETCYEIGGLRVYINSVLRVFGKKERTTLIKRREVKNILGLASGTTDAGVRHHLVERFTPGEPNYGKGTRKSPGWFFGFKDDIWQAYALGVAYIDDKGFEHSVKERFVR